MILEIIRRFFLLFGGLLVCSAVGFSYMWYVGADANWDLANYHLYNPFALLNGRYDRDVFISLQNYINPINDVPFYYLFDAFGVFAAHLYLGLIFSLLIYVVYQLNHSVLISVRHDTSKADRGIIVMFAGIGTAIGLTGAASLGQAVTTFNETQNTLLILLSLLILIDQGREGYSISKLTSVRYFISGCLIGAAVGLKFTAVPYAIGVVSVLLFKSIYSRRVTGMFIFFLGSLSGLMATYGAWAIFLFRKFESPLFPFFNGIFRSPWDWPANFSDHRFLPRDFFEALLYPFSWAVHLRTNVSELPFRDPRIAILLILVATFGIIRIRKREGWHRLDEIILFAVVSYVAWLLRFSILRYAGPLEVITGLLIVVCVLKALDRFVLRRSITVGTALTIPVVMYALTNVPDWGRVPFDVGYKVDSHPLPYGSTVVFGSQPLSHIAALLPHGNYTFAGATGWTTAHPLRRAALKDVIDRTDGEVWMFFIQHEFSQEGIMSLGMRIDPASCSPVTSSIYNSGDIELCRLVKISDSVLVLPYALDFSNEGSEVRMVGMSNPEDWGRWSDARRARTARIEFPAFLPDHFRLSMSMHTIGPNVERETVIKVGNSIYRVKLGHRPKTYMFEVRLDGVLTNRIEITPPSPVSPESLGLNTDTRLLGVAFTGLKIH